MQLMILRHGEAEPNFVNDDARALTGAGQQQVRAVGEYLASSDYKLDLIAFSPLVRTTQTAEIINEYLGVQRFEVWPELIHFSSAEAVETKLLAAACDKILIVSHMPLVASLEGYLVTGNKAQVAPFGTAELAMLSCEEAYPAGWKQEQRVVLA